MSENTQNAIADAVSKQAAGVAVGALTGAILQTPPNLHARPAGPNLPNTALQVGQAMGAAALGGAGLSGTLAAGTAVITAKVAAATALATAAAPFVVSAAVIGGVAYGLYWLSDQDSRSTNS